MAKNALVTGRRKFANKVPIKSKIGNGLTRFMFMMPLLTQFTHYPATIKILFNYNPIYPIFYIIS